MIENFNPTIFTGVVNTYLPEPHASLLNGILFGQPIKSGTEFQNQLKTVGLVHIVVLSGMNITLLSALVSDLTKTLGKTISLLITIATIILFVLFVGVEPPILRAAVMGILTLMAVLYGRKSLAFYTLFLSGIFCIILIPEWITSISFQLSYGATLGLILFAPKEQTSPLPGLAAGLFSYIKGELKISLAAQLFTVPLIWFYFKQISFISPFSNILVSWLIGPLMVIGFITAVLGKIHFILGVIPSYICYGLLSYLIAVIEICSRIPFAAVQF